MLNLSGFCTAQLTFWHRYDLENGADFGQVWIYDGAGFTQLAAFTGVNTTWRQVTINLSPFTGQASVWVVFQLFSNGSVTRDGWYIDDVRVTSSRPCLQTPAPLGIFRPSVEARWFLDTNHNGVSDLSVRYGTNGDIPVPGDYNGSEGLMDLAVFRPSVGRWFIDLNRDGRTDLNRQYGTRGDIPVPGDYTGDGITDVAVFRPSIGR
ncbi:MAG: hypothetical protein AB1671_03560 [Thermodesulfobacteriota bacterium]